MCCGDSILCPAVPEIDWSAFTWLWENPDAEIEYEFEGTIDGATRDLARRIFATEREMIHPGICNCLWLVPISERGRDTADQNGVAAAIPCIGSLQRDGQRWLLSIVRWYQYGWSYINNALTGWDDTYLPGSCNGWNGGAAGWSPYGWNGWGWGYGFGFGWYAWGGSYATRAVYTFSGSKLLTDGSVNRFDLEELVSHGENAEDSGDNRYWPAFVNLTTIPKDGQALK